LIKATFEPARAAEYRAPGGPWARPTLDELLRDAPFSAQVAALAGGLRTMGVHTGDVVTWRSPNRLEVAIAYRACWRIGAVAAPLHHQFGAAELRAASEQLGPSFVLDLDDLPSGPPVDEPWFEPEALAAVLFTSGSSGAPKGVVHTQATLATKALTMRSVHGITPDDVVLMPAPCSHISGLLNGITLPGVATARTVFMARWDPNRALDLIETDQVTFMVGPPTFFVSMMDASDFDPSRVRSLRLVSSGGADVTTAFVRRAQRELGARVKRTYGSTEAPSVATSSADDDESHDATHDGHAIGDVELRISAAGELLVRGPEVCVGYLDAEQTSTAFDADGCFHTGDLADLDADGWLRITGRISEIIIRGGENIAAAEVERVLAAHPSVRAAAVVGEPDDRLGERVCAFVVTDGTEFTLETCRAWFEQQRVARFKTPERVVVLAALPMHPTGKPDKAALAAMVPQ
jgi:cyclohexanecarboxylate-CoA ligase